jgi:hypothetical protein
MLNIDIGPSPLPAPVQVQHGALGKNRANPAGEAGAERQRNHSTGRHNRDFCSEKQRKPNSEAENKLSMGSETSGSGRKAPGPWVVEFRFPPH